jgi:hypothetical protein
VSTSAPTTTLPPTTTTAAPAVLTITPIAELPGRFIEAGFADGSSIIAFSQADQPEPVGTSSIARLDPTGAVIQDVEADPYLKVFGLPQAADRRFLFSQFPTGSLDNMFQCGLREVDLAQLTLGPLLTIRSDDSCGGYWVVDDVDPAVVWMTLGGLGELARVDTRAGVVTAIPVAGSVPAGYDLGRVVTLNGIVYLTLTADYDFNTNQYVTAADGTPLPPELLRVDPAVGATTVAGINGHVGVVDGRIVVYLDDGHVQQLDPTTLAATDFDPSAVIPTQPATSWGTSDGYDDPGVLVVAQFDAAGNATAQASVETGFPADAITAFTPIEIGDDLYVLAAARQASGAPNSITRLYQVHG